MPMIAYAQKDMRADTLIVVNQANEIIAEYQAQGFRLTLRQLYYQFVSRDLLPNTTQSYKRLGGIVNDGRLAGLIDWDAIEDRTRNVQSLSHWETPAEIIDICARQFRIDKWADQPFRPEVWIEKEALAGVVEGVCQDLDISFFCCRGYTSQSEMWSSAMRLRSMVNVGQRPLILHFGDHDPSGIDMTRDITDRLEMFMGGVTLQRMALNMDQIEEYSPPPNPAKITDSRFASYEQKFGGKSWELDALEPKVIAGLIETAVFEVRNLDQWKRAVRKEEAGRKKLRTIAEKM